MSDYAYMNGRWLLYHQLTYSSQMTPNGPQPLCHLSLLSPGCILQHQPAKTWCQSHWLLAPFIGCTLKATLYIRFSPLPSTTYLSGLSLWAQMLISTLQTVFTYLNWDQKQHINEHRRMKITSVNESHTCNKFYPTHSSPAMRWK